MAFDPDAYLVDTATAGTATVPSPATAGFDPDQFMADTTYQATPVPQETGGFNPDEYLQSTEPAAERMTLGERAAIAGTVSAKKAGRVFADLTSGIANAPAIVGREIATWSGQGPRQEHTPKKAALIQKGNELAKEYGITVDDMDVKGNTYSLNLGRIEQRTGRLPNPPQLAAITSAIREQKEITQPPTAGEFFKTAEQTRGSLEQTMREATTVTPEEEAELKKAGFGFELASDAAGLVAAIPVLMISGGKGTSVVKGIVSKVPLEMRAKFVQGAVSLARKKFNAAAAKWLEAQAGQFLGFTAQGGLSGAAEGTEGMAAGAAQGAKTAEEFALGTGAGGVVASKVKGAAAKVATKVISGGATFGGVAAFEGAKPREIAKQAILGAGLSAAGVAAERFRANQARQLAEEEATAEQRGANTPSPVQPPTVALRDVPRDQPGPDFKPTPGRKFGGVRVKVEQKDGLTGLPNNAVTKAYQAKLPGDHWGMSIDGDTFKAVNDAAVGGHAAGDAAIRGIGGLLEKHFPEFFRGREGGEEFFVDLGTDLTPELKARVAAFVEDVPRQIRIPHQTPEGTIEYEPFTLSVGVAKGMVIDKTGKPKVASDDAAYRAKEAGRNRVAFVEEVDNGVQIEYHIVDDPGPKNYVRSFAKKELAKYGKDFTPEQLAEIFGLTLKEAKDAQSGTGTSHPTGVAGTPGAGGQAPPGEGQGQPGVREGTPTGGEPTGNAPTGDVDVNRGVSPETQTPGQPGVPQVPGAPGTPMAPGAKPGPGETGQPTAGPQGPGEVTNRPTSTEGGTTGPSGGGTEPGVPRGTTGTSGPTAPGETTIPPGSTAGPTEPTRPPTPPPGMTPEGAAHVERTAPEMPPETKWEWFQRKVQNKLNRLLKVQTVKGEGKPLDDKSNAYLKARLMPGRVEVQYEAGQREFVEPLVRQMRADKTDMEDLQLYTMAKFAPDRNATVAKIAEEFAVPGQPVGKNADLGLDFETEKANLRRGLPGSGMFATEADKAKAIQLNPGDAQVAAMPVAETILADFEAKGKTAALERAAKYVYAMNAKTRQMLLDAGLIDKEMYDAWEQHSLYVPLRGIAGQTPPATRTGQGFQVRGPESRRALGRRSLAENVIGTSAVQYAEAVMRAEKNRVDQAFLDFVKKNPDPNVYQIVEGIPTKRSYDSRLGKVVEREDFDWLRRPENQNVLALKVDGKPVYIRILDEPLARAMTGMGSEHAGKIVGGLATLNRYLSVVNTTLVPEFVVSNFARDLQTALVNISGETGLSKPAARGLASDILKRVLPCMRGVWEGESGGKTEAAQYYREYKGAGGRIGFFSMKDAESAQKGIVKAIEAYRRDPAHMGLRYATAVGNFISRANQAVENATRLSTYIAMRKRGMSVEQSALAARSITVDFNLKGEKGPLINALWLFSNASIQGTARLLTALKSPKVRALAAGITALSFGNAEMNRQLAGDDPDDKRNRYDKIPPNEKQRNMIFMGVGPDGQHVMIPIPYGYNVFWSMGQAASSAIHGDPAEGALTVAEAIISSFNPIGGQAGDWFQGLVPTAARLPADLWKNMNYLGQPIVPEEKYGPPKAMAFRHFKSTTGAAKAVSETASKLTGGSPYHPGLVDIAPDQLDYIFEYVTGGAGRTVSRAVNIAAKMFTRDPIKAREIPFVRRLYGELHESGDMSAFYDSMEKVNATKAEMKNLEETEPKKAGAYAAKHRGSLQLTGNPQELERWFGVKHAKGEDRREEITRMTQSIDTLRQRAKAEKLKGQDKMAEMTEDLIRKKAKQFTAILSKAEKGRD